LTVWTEVKKLSFRLLDLTSLLNKVKDLQYIPLGAVELWLFELNRIVFLESQWLADCWSDKLWRELFFLTSREVNQNHLYSLHCLGHFYFASFIIMIQGKKKMLFFPALVSTLVWVATWYTWSVTNEMVLEFQRRTG